MGFTVVCGAGEEMHPLAFLFFFLLSIANCEDPRASQASLYTSNVVLYFLFLSYSEVDVRPPACMPVYLSMDLLVYLPTACSSAAMCTPRLSSTLLRRDLGGNPIPCWMAASFPLQSLTEARRNPA